MIVEDSFDDQVYELATYVETIKKEAPGTLSSELQALEDREEAIKKLVGAAGILMSAPEKG